MMTWAVPGRLTLAVAAGSLAALGVAACGGGSAGGPAASSSSGSAAATAQATAAAAGAASPVSACSLLSAAKASAVVGVTYSAATETESGQMCSYPTTTAPIPMFIIISPGAGATAWSGELQTLEDDCGATPIKLSGAGDRAAGCGTEIGVQDGSRIIDVHGGDPLGTGNAFPKSIDVAKAVIAALN
jgi:hypothetical protein